MTEKNTLTLSGRIRSVTFALRGIRIMVASQQNAWIHAAATVAVVAAGLFVGLSWPEWCWIVLAIVSVWTAEALNTEFEFLTDVASRGSIRSPARRKMWRLGPCSWPPLAPSLLGRWCSDRRW